MLNFLPKRLLSILAVLVLVAFVAAGCGGQQPAAKPPEKPASAPAAVVRQNSSRIITRWPFGNTISTASSARPPSSRRAAASDVAVAQLPVV